MYWNRQNNNLALISDRSQMYVEIDDGFAEKPVERPDLTEGKDLTFLFFIPILFLIVGLFFKSSRHKISQVELKLVKNHPKIACRQCHYFDNNPYLKCSLHPDKALTKEAVNCLDYQTKNDTKKSD